MTQTTSTAVRFFIAVPANDPGDGIFGLGTTPEAAVKDACEQSHTRAPDVSKDDDGDWVVSYEGTYDAFSTMAEAEAHAETLGFKARPCTERLYRHIEAHGCDASTFGWAQASRDMDDLAIDEEDLAAALAEVKDGLDGSDGHAEDEWKAETALEEARALVDFYVWDVEDSDIEGAVNDDREFRTALDLAVRDLILGSIAERDAA